MSIESATYHRSCCRCSLSKSLLQLPSVYDGLLGCKTHVLFSECTSATTAPIMFRTRLATWLRNIVVALLAFAQSPSKSDQSVIITIILYKHHHHNVLV